MDTSDPFIRFDKDGLCNHCTNFLETRIKVTAHNSDTEPSLSNFFENIKSSRPSGVNYDAIVGVSGGVDSSFTALLASKYGLKVLALHMDNGWDTPIAIENIYNLIKLPGIDYHAEVLNWNSFKLIQKAFIDSGVPDIEMPTDIAIQAVLHKVASKYGIQTILSGGNIANEGILPSAWLYNARDSFYGESLIKKSGLSLRDYKQIKFGFRQEIKSRFINKIKTLYPLNKFIYDKEAARDVLSKEINWKSYGGKHCESTFTRFTQLIYLPRRHNVDYRRGYLSADICLGSLSRQEALNQLQRKPWEDIDVERDSAFVARKLDYTLEEIDYAMNLPPLWYTDYPNRQYLLGLAYDFYRLINRRPKASNF